MTQAQAVTSSATRRSAGIIADGVFKVLLGAAYLIGAPWLGDLLGVSTWLMVVSGVALLIGGGKAADEDGPGHLPGSGVGGRPGRGRRGGVPHHQGGPGCFVHGGEHCRQLVVERRGGVAVALAGEGERHGTVARRGEFGHDVVPCGSEEPQAGDEQDLHRGLPERGRVPGGREDLKQAFGDVMMIVCQ